MISSLFTCCSFTCGFVARSARSARSPMATSLHPMSRCFSFFFFACLCFIPEASWYGYPAHTMALDFSPSSSVSNQLQPLELLSKDLPKIRSIEHAGPVVPFAPTWDKVTAFRYLIYSFSTYDDDDVSVISSWTCKLCKIYQSETAGIREIQIFQHRLPLTLAWIGVNPTYKEIVIAFQGSDHVRHLFVDVNFEKMQFHDDFPDARVHAGFLRSYRGVSAAIETALKKLLVAHAGFTVRVTGHSLGGGIATICALDIAHRLKIQVESYTFASPRVGNAAFVTAYQSNIRVTWRQTHDKDPVPHVPPIKLGYQHVAREIWETDVKDAKGNFVSANFTECSPIDGEDRHCSRSVFANYNMDAIRNEHVIRNEHAIYWNVNCGTGLLPGWFKKHFG